MDQIKIDNLKVFAYHGVFDFEKENGQDFYINAIINTDLRKAGLSDRLEESINYGEICEFISNSIKRKKYNLIESVAEQTTKELFLQFPKIQSIEIEIRKPSAPIKLSFESVSVKIIRGWHDAYLSFGSNMGEKELYIKDALEKLGHNGNCRLKEISSLIVTSPYGGVDQDDFLNGACHIQTLLEPEELLSTLHKIEKEAMRERTIHWGPRTLDLDILFYDNRVYESNDLIIPHIDLEHRLFVLEPMNEIAPNLRHPISKKTVHQMYLQLKE